MDLSGSMQGAGGVGGLLAVSEHGMTTGSSPEPTRTPYYPTFDGNGNVSEYLDDAGEAVAHYEYDAFGNTVATLVDGQGVDINMAFEFRFSTKPLDTETGLYYYGYRYYDPLTGRWPSRDPIAEKGGDNLYCFVKNSAAGRIDILGHIRRRVGPCKGYLYLGHGSITDAIDWTLNGMRAIAGAVTCWPASNAPKDPWESARSGYRVPTSALWPNVPQHDEKLYSGDLGETIGDYLTVIATAGSESGSDPAWEMNYQKAARNALASIPLVIASLCKSCCPKVEIIIEVAPDDYLKDDITKAAAAFGYQEGIKKTEFNCPNNED